jgi:hypothetical protein
MLIHAVVDFPLNQPVAALLFWFGIGTVMAISLDQSAPPPLPVTRYVALSHRLLQWRVPWASWRPAGRRLMDGVVLGGVLLLAGVGVVQAVRPVVAAAYQRDAEILMAQQRWAAASTVITQGLAWEPWQAELTLYAGVAHYQLGNLALSRAAYERYQLLYSDFQTLYNLGLIAVRQHQLSQAEGYFREALRHKPTLSRVAEALAFVTERMGRPEDASRYRQQAIRLRSTGG